MSDTYTQIYILDKKWRERVFDYIGGIIRNNNHKILAINGIEDHIHILIGLNPAQAISDLVRIVKSDSTKFINENKLSTVKFRWQNGYGAFSYAKSQIDYVIKYIKNQEVHHQNKSFHNEWDGMLSKFDIKKNINSTEFDFFDWRLKLHSIFDTNFAEPTF